MAKHELKFSPEVNRGIELVNQGKYFQAHELLEFAWRQESNETRHLYQGLVQVSAMLYHLERGNTKGAHKLVRMALDNIIPFMELPTSLDIQRLVHDLLRLTVQLEVGDESAPLSTYPFSFKLHTQQALTENN